MDATQEWCLQCGAGAPDSLITRTPSWRSTAMLLGTTAILAVGAGTAAYAALSKAGARRATATVAQAPAPTAATPVAPATGTATPAAPKAAKPAPPVGTVKPPKIPLAAATPKSSPTATPPTATTSPTSTTSPTATTPKSGNEGAKTTTEQTPTPILLDTNAVATYNPYNYPASNFGDPSLAIDGDTSTGWTARLDPAVAPKVAVGLVIDLNAAQKLSALELVTSTPGMAVHVFGANTSVLPTSITDPAWVQLSPYHVEKKRHALLKLGDSTKAFNFITLWISKAPASSIGTPQAPGLVSVNEIELFPAK
jgi:hypothetical protein